jgi:hypothetical protein
VDFRRHPCESWDPGSGATVAATNLKMDPSFRWDDDKWACDQVVISSVLTTFESGEST